MGGLRSVLSIKARHNSCSLVVLTRAERTTMVAALIFLIFCSLINTRAQLLGAGTGTGSCRAFPYRAKVCPPPSLDLILTMSDTFNICLTQCSIIHSNDIKHYVISVTSYVNIASATLLYDSKGRLVSKDLWVSVCGLGGLSSRGLLLYWVRLLQA